MIDLHTHTFFSDGDLIPSELVCRAKNAGYYAIALTDHADFSNMDFVIRRITRITDGLRRYYKINVIAGCEITYIPPELISKAVQQARKLGAKIVVVHGESPVEPAVPKGTNRAAILSRCDILAHPGYITEEDVRVAKKNNVLLEITTRNGHRIGNWYVAEFAKKIGAKLVMDTDTHKPEDLFSEKKIKDVLKEAKLTQSDFAEMQKNAKNLIMSF
ncbi:MAG: PHP domain-containing protein [Elusimicrobia bacterium CG06_land_8_20_14_3_00_38_11]|nr:MAG: PHP domain-containing protein [Elusimicrobia bacterium CG06_land_8_20_14_3_00_38_11]